MEPPPPAPADSGPAGGPAGAHRVGRGTTRGTGWRRWLTGWRYATPVVLLLSGSLFAISASDSDGTDLRPGRYRDLASVVEAEAREYEALSARVSTLSAEVDALTDDVDAAPVERAVRRAERLRDPAGLVPRTGAGVSVVLADAPEDAVSSAIAGGELDLNRLVVHQQDIQAVVNALWRGGATAVTVAGQRIVTTTGIKCEGNAVQLQGVPYPQPYEIAAVGAPEELVAAVEDDEYLANYRIDAADPDIDVGWDLAVEPRVRAPAFEGLLDISYAEPLA